MSEKRHYKKKRLKTCSPKTDELIVESDDYFSFIAGYTESGVPFGLSWEEHDPNHEKNSTKPRTEKK